MSSRRNCKRCTRWRPIADYRVTKTRNGHEYPGRTCCHCELIATRVRKRRQYQRDRDRMRIIERSRARKRRREAGVPERGKYKRKGSPPMTRSVKTDLMLRYGPK